MDKCRLDVLNKSLIRAVKREYLRLFYIYLERLNIDKKDALGSNHEFQIPDPSSPQGSIDIL